MEAPTSSQQPQEDGPRSEEPAGEEPEAQVEYPIRVKPGPPDPTALEKDNHQATGHAIFRCWCDPCVRGRGRGKGHYEVDHEGERVPVLSWDYGFLSSKSQDEDAQAEASGQSPVLCCRDRISGTCMWYLVPRKGLQFATNLVQLFRSDMNALG